MARPNRNNTPNKKDAKTKARKAGSLSVVVFRFYRIFSLLIFVAIIGASYYFLLKPRYEDIQQGGRYNVETLQVELEQRQAHFQALDQLIKKMNALSASDIARLELLLPDEKGIADLFVQAQEIAEQHGFLLSSISVADAGNSQARRSRSNVEEKPMGIQRLSVSLSLLGPGYESMKELLDAFETNLRLFDINAVYFTPGSAAYSINLFTYYLPNS